MPELMLLGAAIFAVGALFGRLMPARRKHPKPPKPPEPICGCKHHHSFHDPKTGKCSALMYVPSTMMQDSRHIPCTCRQYSGPVPLSEVYAPEITNG